MTLRRTAAAVVSMALVLGGAVAGTTTAYAATTTAMVAAPDGLVTSAHGTGTEFAWDRVDGATGYSVQLATEPTFADSNVLITASTTARSWIPTTNIDGPTERTVYWRVASFSSGTSTASMGAYSTAQQLERPAAQSPTLTTPADGATVTYPDPVTFTWTAVPGAVSYTLIYSTDDAFPTGSTTTTQVLTGTSYSPTAPLARSTSDKPVTWYWKVVPSFTGRTGLTVGPAQPSASTFTVTWPVASSRPTPQSPTSASEVYNDLLFSWTPVRGAAKYVITIGGTKDTTTGDVANVVDTAETTSSTYVPFKQISDGTYYWQVTAYDAANNPGTRSDVTEFRKAWGAQTTPSAPAAGFSKSYPEPTTGSTDRDNPTMVPLDRVLLTWEPLPRATLYEVEASPILSGEDDDRVVLTCHTASTSVTVVSRVDEGANNTAALGGDGTCLWNSTKAKRMDPGGLYKWRVMAIDYAGAATTPLQTALPVNTQTSAWSDVYNGDVSRARYFEITDPTSPTGPTAVVDDASWTSQSTIDIGKPSPTFAWSPVTGANAYRVDLYSDTDCTVHIGSLWTTSTRALSNGVFADKTSGEYCWTVQGVKVTNESFSQWEVPVGSNNTAGRFWKKSSTPTQLVDASASVTSTADGSKLLTWRPQAETGSRDGGSRGYQVTIFNSSNVSIGAQRVEWPWFVVKNPTNSKPLGTGDYFFTVAALDALGNAGNPTAPVGFHLEAPAPTPLAPVVSGTTATLSWAPTATASKYQAQYRPGGTQTWIKAPATGTLTQDAVTVSDLDDGTYEWTVASYDSSGNASASSPTGTFVVTAPAPAPDTEAGAVLTTDDRRLAWAAVPGASRYLVQYAPSIGLLDAAAPAETVSTEYVIPTTLPYGTQYYWQVTAVPEKATTSSTRVKLGKSTPREFTVSNPPTSPVIASAKTDGTTLTVTWLTPGGSARGSLQAPGIRLNYRALNPDGTLNAWTTVELGANVESRSLTGLHTSTTYEVALQAYNDEGSGGWSASKTAKTASVPTVVTNLTLSPALGGLGLRWSAPNNGGSPVTSYTVRYRTGTAAWRTISTTSTSATLSGLLRSASYTVSVAAVNRVGTGPAATASKTTLGLPGSPTSLTAKRGDRSATLTWRAPTSTGGLALSGFQVERRAYSSSTKKWGAWTGLRGLSAVTRTTSVTSLVNGTRYEFRVRAKTSAGLGAVSASVAVVPAGKPKAPTSVKVSVYTHKAKIAWKRVASNGSAITSYKVQYSTNARTWKTLKTASATASSYTWTKPKKGKKYYVRVLAYNAVGASPASSYVAFTAK